MLEGTLDERSLSDSVLVESSRTDRASIWLTRGIWALIWGAGILLPLPLLATSPFHHDEALYAYWARLIASGQDLMLHTVPVDKPPLFIYTVALFFKLFDVSDTVARLPSLIAHFATIGLTFLVGKQLYDERIGLLATLLVSLSPYTILFVPTALTDPLMVAWVMLSTWAAAKNKPVWAALGLGLAAATKQQGLFFLPLIVGVLIIARANKPPEKGRRLRTSLIRFFLVYLLSLIIPLIWDFSRLQKPGFWLQSSLSYGGIQPTVGHFTNRLFSYLDLLEFVSASQILNLIFMVGLPLLLLFGLLFRPYRNAQAQTDWLLAAFCLIFLLLHAIFRFQVWDRYLLGLVPLLALLLARIFHFPNILFRSRMMVTTVAAVALVVALLAAGPIQTAMRGGYPLGGDHGAFTGAEEVARYLRQHVPANTTLYHRWLGTHWRYYLFNFPYDLRFWQTPADLAQQAQTNANGVQYIAFPAWQSMTEVQFALSKAGLALVPILETARQDGAPAIFLYKFEAAE